MKTAICIASGPSLTKDDVDYCQGKGRVYAVKEAAILAPWADVLYAADTDWWTEHQERWRGFEGDKITVSERACTLFPELKHIKCRTQDKWSNTPGVIATGGNSGFQALNIAVLDGADRVILLGYDYGHKKEKHWFDKEHPRKSRYSNYKEWNRRLNEAAPFIPVPVLNASPETVITCFDRVNLKDIL